MFWIYWPQAKLCHQNIKTFNFTGNLSDFRECHIEPDWLLIYQIFENELILSATATGSHSDLFK
jgi:mRNA interferase YafQ